MKFTSILSVLVVVPSLAMAQGINSDAQREQQGIKDDSIHLQAQLRSLLAEMDANKISSGDRVIVEKLLSSLGNLSDKEMTNVIALLGSNKNDTATKLEIYRNQSTIKTGLASMGDALAVEEALTGLSDRIGKVLVRQAGNLRETQSLSRNQNATEAAQSPAGEASTTEQKSIGDEIGLILNLLQRKAITTDANQQSKKLLAVTPPDVLVQQTLAAPQAISDGKFSDALTNEKAILTTVQEWLALIDKDISPAERLKQLRDAISALSSEQGQLAASVAPLREGIDSLADLEGTMGDRASVLQTKAEAMSGVVAQALSRAADSMGKASDGLYKFASWNGSLPGAKANVAQADTALHEALAALDDQIAQASSNPNSSPTPSSLGEKLADYQQIARDLSALATAQNSASPADAAAQNAIAQKGQEIQKKLSEHSPAAAVPLGKAIANSKDVAAPDATDDKKKQSATEAAANIAKAQAEVKKDIDNLAAEINKKKNNEDINKALADAKENLKSAETNLNSRKTAAAVPDLKSTQSSVEAALAAAKSSNGSAAQNENAQSQNGGKEGSELETTLASASKNLSDARDRGAMGDVEGAKSSAAQAKSDLAKAQQIAALQTGKPVEQPGGYTDKGSDGNSSNTMAESKNGFKAISGVPPSFANRDAKYSSTRLDIVDAKRQATLSSLNHEGYPIEYASMVEQYWKSLSASSPSVK